MSINANFIRKLPCQTLPLSVEAMLARAMLLAESTHRQSTLLLLRDELPPRVPPRFWCLRHADSIGDDEPLAKWCSRDAYGRWSHVDMSTGAPYKLGMAVDFRLGGNATVMKVRAAGCGSGRRVESRR